MGYLSNFIVYLLAMIGLMMLALFIFKNCAPKINNTSGKNIKILDSISIGARKNLLIVSVGDEKFLVASDADRTTLISKLESKDIQTENISNQLTRDNKDYTTKSFSNREVINLHKEQIVGQKNSYNSVMRNLAERMKV